ncbi:MAG: hypothetical protein KA028_03045 [Candidatus Pacebacteria bacterium]|nr:hypothetical protein [Candidatus Paceibacterota bacterium]
MEKRKDQYVDLDNARGEEYIALLNQIIEDGVCPFCDNNIEKYGNVILRQTGHWIIIKNKNPYPGRKTQIMAISKVHAETLSDLSDEASLDLIRLMQSVAIGQNVAGGAMAMRFGDTKKSGATVRHLHAQLIEPEDNTFVTFHIGYEKEK